jgi:aminopeptidase-like protein
MMNLISFCDGDHSLLDIAELLGQPINLLSPVLEHLASAELVDMSTDITTKLR